MKAEFENIPLVNNEKNNRFEIEVNGFLAFINYGESATQYALVHTEAAEELKGTGAAAALVEKTLEYIEKSEKKILPFCPYVFSFIKKHSEWKRVVDNRFLEYDQL